MIPPAPDGILVVDKPAGPTSHDVVDVVRRRIGARRVGHAGTLDPSATGVLVIGVGRATRLLQFMERYDKEYRAGVVFGIETTTQDADGDVVAQSDASRLDRPTVETALAAFRGEIAQVPPMVSALKVGGEALYRKARRGEDVPREPRRVVVHEIVLEELAPGDPARAILRIRCSKGTYVRTLAHDLGRALGVGAHVAALRRLAVGRFREADAVALEAITADGIRPMEDAVSGYPRREVGEPEARALAHGRALPPAGIDGPYAVIGPAGLVAMAEDRDAEARPICVVAAG